MRTFIVVFFFQKKTVTIFNIIGPSGNLCTSLTQENFEHTTNWFSNFQNETWEVYQWSIIM